MRNRIIKYLNHKGISKYKFYKDTGLSNGYLDKSADINSSSYEKISSQYRDLNMEWVRTGEGEMLKGEYVQNNIIDGSNNSQSNSQNNSQNTTNNYYGSSLPCDTKTDTTEENPINDRNSLKYYYELSATASNIENISDNELNQPYTLINFPGYEGCVGFNVAGESMYPTMKERDIVAIKPEKIDFIVNGEIYLVVTRDGQRMIKRLCVVGRDDDSGDIIRCISDNPNQELYAPFTIYGKDVHNIFRVKGTISTSFFE